MDRERVLAAYADGVEDVRRAAAGMADWSSPTPCPGWTAIDVAGHLLATVGSYHRLLDAALEGAPSTDLPLGADLARRNASDLAALPRAGGPDLVRAFAGLADQYADRLRAVPWGQVLGVWRDLGPLSVGEHAELAALEWHLHAGDLAAAAGRPDVHVRGGITTPRTGPRDPAQGGLVCADRSSAPETARQPTADHR